MQCRSALVVGALLLSLSLTACASAAGHSGVAPSGAMSEPSETGAPADASETTDAAARAQAQAWLEAATLPLGAIRSDVSVGSFNSFTGWPCGPVEKLEAFWRNPDTTVHETANWLMEHPTADLMTTAVAPVPDDPAIDSAIVGYILRRTRRKESSNDREDR